MRTIQIESAAYLLAALLLLTLPLNWFLAALTAAVIHELFHFLGILLAGGRIMGIQIGAGGARITVAGLTTAQELFCALSGPVGGLLLLFLCRWFPRIALCGLVQSAFNLLPVFPLDGGRAVQCAVSLFLPEGKRDALCRFIERLFLLGIAFLGVWAAWVVHSGWLLFLAALLLVLKKNTLQRRETRGTIVLPNTKR